jgi:hypothetical protein
MQTLNQLVQGRLAGKALDRVVETSARLAHRCLYKPHVVWWNNRQWLKPYEPYLDCDRILDRRFTLIQWAQAVRGLAGCTAECGVYTGVGSALICKTLEGTYAADEHFGFDSFEGLSQPCEADRFASNERHAFALWYKLRKQWRRGHLRCSQEKAQRRVRDFPFCKLIRGWIPSSFGSVPDRVYRFVHIDVDIYQPTWDSLAYFYPRLAPGGVLLFDDYGHMTCPGSRLATDEFFRDKPESIVELTTGQALVIKSRAQH